MKKEKELQRQKAIQQKKQKRTENRFSESNNALGKLSLYLASITDDISYYDSIEILNDSLNILNIYNCDTKDRSVHFISYEDMTLTKSLGEASFKLEIETDTKTFTVTGLFSDFFTELKKYTAVE